MQFKKEEVAVMFHAVVFGNDGKPKTYAFPQLIDAGSSVKSFQGGVEADGSFQDAEIELSDDVKKLVIDQINGREWAATDAELVTSLLEKLK